MGQIVLGITEGKRAAQFMRLPSVRFYLGEDALGRNGVDNFPGYFKVAGVEGNGYHLRIVGRTVVVGLAGFFLSLRAGQYPVQQLAEPCLQLLGIFGRKRLRLLQQLHGIQHLYKGVTIQHAVATAFAAVVSGYHLRILQVGIHACILVEEPYADKLRCLLGILLFSAEVPGQCQRGDAAGGCSQAVAVELVQFGVRFAVAAHVRQSVGLCGVRPIIAGLAHVVVLVATGRHLLFHHNGKRLYIQ